MYSTKTQLFTLNPVQPDSEIIARASQVLSNGGLVAFPTETVYGLGANALDESAVGRIFTVKRRPFNDPLIVHIAEKSEIDEIGTEIPDIAYRLVDKFWPGPLTLVLKRHPRVAHNVSAGLGTVAVRIPAHPVALALIRAASVPVAAPSANLFTRPSPTTAQHVLDDLFGHVDIVLDAGPTPIGLESTVLDLTSHAPEILRPGGVPAEALREIIPGLILPEREKQSEEKTGKPSPGMMLKHYSPKAKFLLFKGGGEQSAQRVSEFANMLLEKGYKVGWMILEEDRPFSVNQSVEIESLGRQGDLEGIAKSLFAKMRALDNKKVDYILMRDLGGAGLGLAIQDRLFKAAEQQVINLDEPSNFESIVEK